jgi:hypothetical protein
MRKCPHGVSQEVTVETRREGDQVTETFRFLECLLCTEEQGKIVLYETSQQEQKL